MIYYNVKQRREVERVKKLLKTASALALCAVILLTAMPTAHGATIYFMAANDTLLELNASNMPAVVGGVLYVPYTMLSASATGVNLGVYASYSSMKGTVLVYSNRKQLFFDLQNDLTYDLDGQYYDERAIVRNSTIYLPIARVCSVFSDKLSYSICATKYGYLVRVCNSSAVLGDTDFISATDSMMRAALTRYQQENPESAGPEASPVASSPNISGSGAGVYLAFVQTENGTLNSVVDALTAQDCQGLFFLTADQLAQQDDLVRQLVGSGQFVGFRSSAQSGQEVLEELEQAKELLSAIAHCRLAVVLAEELDEAGIEQVEQAGYVCWQTTTDGRDLEEGSYSQISALIRRLTDGEEGRNYLLLDDQAGSALTRMLSGLDQADYQFRAPVATEL